jgi:CheY-like chemotaxis protein
MTMPSQAANAPALEAPLHVLVLDDDPLLLEVMREMLAACGLSNIALETQACSALRRLHQSVPDVVICDLMMPEMDGIEFLQAAAAQGYQGKVILMSALEDGVDCKSSVHFASRSNKTSCAQRWPVEFLYNRLNTFQKNAVLFGSFPA